MSPIILTEKKGRFIWARLAAAIGYLFSYCLPAISFRGDTGHYPGILCALFSLIPNGPTAWVLASLLAGWGNVFLGIFLLTKNPVYKWGAIAGLLASVVFFVGKPDVSAEFGYFLWLSMSAILLALTPASGSIIGQLRRGDRKIWNF